MDEREDAEHGEFPKGRHVLREGLYIIYSCHESGRRLQYHLFRGALNEVTSHHGNATQLDRQGRWRFSSLVIRSHSG